LFVGVLKVELLAGEGNSLKDKRRALKSLMGRLKNKFNVSVAETDHQEVWQRAQLALSMVSNEQGHIHNSFSSITKFIEAQPNLELISYNIQIF
jgi:uncharacterized protein YlxP (DUF503 family)